MWLKNASVFFMACAVLASSALYAADGFLLIKGEKVSYANPAPPAKGETNTVSQSYKIEINADFLSQFKNPPIAMKSAGTQLHCSVSDGASYTTPGIVHTQWFSPWNPKKKIRTWFWAMGSEIVNGATITARNPSVTTSISFPAWESVESAHNLSFVNNYDGVNVGVDIRYAEPGDKDLVGALLAPVKMSDGKTFLVPGDPQKDAAFTANCAFQEN